MTNRSPSTLTNPALSDTYISTLSLPQIWHFLWFVRLGAGKGDKRTMRRGARAMVLERVGSPAVSVRQHGPREWTVTIFRPTDWATRIRDAGLALAPADHRGARGIVLDVQPLGDTHVRAWVMRQPHARRNGWVVVAEDYQRDVFVAGCATRPP